MTSLAASMRSSRSIGSSATSLASSAASKRGGAARILLAPQSPMSMTSMLRTVPPPPSLTSSASTFSTTHRPRGFFASAASASPSSPASSSSLISVLDTEIEYEKEHAPSGPPELPEGWAFDDAGGDGSEADGSARLTLRSTRAPAGETVTIDLLIDDQDEEDDGYGFGDGDEEGDDDDVEVDDEEEEVDDAGIVFTVSVAKESSPGADLLFDCRSDGTYLQIMHVSLEKKQEGKVGAGDDDDDAEFSGPHFDELDEALQAEFESYLDERGVTPFLGGALAALAEDKEAREYAAWLVKVRDFVAGR